MKQKNLSFSTIITFFLCLSPIIDNLIGIVLLGDAENSQIGKVFRVLFLMVIIFFAVRFQRFPKRILEVFLIILFSFSFSIFLYFSHGNIKGLLNDLTYQMKLYFPIILICIFIMFYKRGLTSFAPIRQTVNFYKWFYPLSLIIPYFLGWGRSVYRSGIGFSGFYNAPNEICIVLCCLFALSIDDFINKISFLNLIKVGMILYAVLLTAMKTGIILSCCTIIVFLFRKTTSSKRILYLGMIILIGGITLLLLGTLFEDNIVNYISFLKFRYYQLGNSITNVIFSSRNLRIIPNFQDNFSSLGSGLTNFFIGLGRYQQVDLKPALYGLIEMDLFDVFFENGVLIFIFLITFYGRCFINDIKRSKFVYKYCFAILATFSILAGHVLYSALAGTMLALICISLYVDKENLP